MPIDSLAAHTPSTAYVSQSVKRRALELLGAQGRLVNTLAPLPYQSQYPLSPKLLDALITLSIDPIIKPASLKGELDQMPALKKLATTLADKGYFRTYPKGGIGIGGGSEGGGSDGTGTTGGGETGAGFGPGEVGPGGPGIGEGPTGPGFGPEGDPTFGNFLEGLQSIIGLGPNRGTAENITALATSLLSTLTSMFGGPPIGGIGLVGQLGIGTARSQANTLATTTGMSPNDAMAALAEVSQASAAANAASGLSSAQGGGGQGLFFANEMTQPGPVIGATPGPATKPISPATRANAAARVGGGISPSFLDLLEGGR